MLNLLPLLFIRIRLEYVLFDDYIHIQSWFSVLLFSSCLGGSAFSGWSISVSGENAIGVVGRDRLVFFQELEVIQECIGHYFLCDESVDYHSCSDQNAIDMMGHAERNQHESFTSNLHDDNLEDKDHHDNTNEQIVIEEVLEDIGLFFLQFPGVEEVEHL